MNVECPHCQTRVNTTSGGKCPICHRSLEDAAIEVDEAAIFDAEAVEPDLVTCPMCGAKSAVGVAQCWECGEELDLTHVAISEGGLWREGSHILVMHKGAELPDRCVKSNQPASRRMKYSLSWHPPLVFVLLLICGLIPYLIVALITRKTAKIEIGLSEEWHERRRRAILICWGLCLTGIALIALAVTETQTGGIAALLGALLTLAGLIFALIKVRMVRPKKITDEHVWLRGCHPSYLANLPEWSGD